MAVAAGLGIADSQHSHLSERPAGQGTILASTRFATRVLPETIGTSVLSLVGGVSRLRISGWTSLDSDSLPRLNPRQLKGELRLQLPQEGGRQGSPPAQPVLPAAGRRGAVLKRNRGREDRAACHLALWAVLPSPRISHSPPIPPGLSSSSSSSPKDRWGLAGRNVTTVRALSSGNRVRGSQLCPPRPGQSLMSGLVSQARAESKSQRGEEGPLRI